MPRRLAVLLLAASCASTPQSLPNWGIMTSGGEAPVAFAPRAWREGSVLRAYRIGDYAASADVSVTGARGDPDSPLFLVAGGSSSWRHAAIAATGLPRGALWICLPRGWSARPKGPHAAELSGPHGEKGSIADALGQEGVNVTVQLGPTKERLYFHLGYDVAPEAGK